MIRLLFFFTREKGSRYQTGALLNARTLLGKNSSGAK
jgi:hypothetical protein